MDYIGNKKYWDEKFINRSDKLLAPEKSLVENIALFKKGSVLDIACGDGRNSIYLIENGFKITAIDFSIIALKRLKIFAKKSNYSVSTKQIDLSVKNSLKELNIFDNVVINHYRLNKTQFADIKNHITENGLLFICGFGHKHKVDSKIRQEDLIQPNDFEDIGDFFELIKYVESEDDRGFFVTYIFRKKMQDNLSCI